MIAEDRVSQKLGLVLSSGALLLAACSGEPLVPDRCNIRLATIMPDPATLEVGQTVTLEAQLADSPDCLPSDAKPANLRWTSDNPSVAAIDSLSGRLTATGAGAAQVSLFTSVTHTLLTQSSVKVT
jgi:hypothetical protein